MIIENGTGLSNSNSYASEPEARAYCLERNIIAFKDKTPIELSAFLVRATDLIDTGYVFRSVKATDAQALECPRYGETAISAKVKAAMIELAILLSLTDLASPAARGITSKEVTAGRVSTKTTFDDLPKASRDPYPLVSKLLRGIASRVGSSVQSGMMTR